MALMPLQSRKEQSEQSIEISQSWGSVLFFSHCGALGDFITNSPQAFGFYLCQVNWTEESGESWNQPFLDNLAHRASYLPRKDESTSPSHFIHPTLFSLFSL